MSHSDDTASPRQRIRDLEKRVDGLQVRYQLACNGRRDAEMRVKKLEGELTMANVKLNQASDLAQQLAVLTQTASKLESALRMALAKISGDNRAPAADVVQEVIERALNKSTGENQYRRVAPGEPMYAMIQANRLAGQWVCDSADHNEGCSNPECFNFKGKKV